MNCRPGDLARAIRPGPYQNKLFFVLHAAPVGVQFRLPDGYMHAAVEAGFWVVESAGAPVRADTELGSRMARYGVGADAGLRPIRDQDGEDETLSWKEKPKSAADLRKEANELTERLNTALERLRKVEADIKERA